jgi:hypothetical protein
MRLQIAFRCTLFSLRGICVHFLAPLLTLFLSALKPSRSQQCGEDSSVCPFPYLSVTTMCCFQILTNCLTVWLYLYSWIFFRKTCLWWQFLKSLYRLIKVLDPIHNPESPHMSYTPVKL